jgi:hypothetical protein
MIVGQSDRFIFLIMLTKYTTNYSQTTHNIHKTEGEKQQHKNKILNPVNIYHRKIWSVNKCISFSLQ